MKERRTERFSLSSEYWRQVLSVVFSLVSVAIALASFAYTCATNKRQDERWLALAVPRFAITSTRAIAWEEISKEQAFSRDWGYQPLVFPHTEDYLMRKEMRVYSYLVLWDGRRGIRLFGHAPVPTVRQARAEAKRLGIAEYELRQMFAYEVNLRNVGQLPASNVWHEVENSDRQTGKVLATKRTNPVAEVAGGADFHFDQDLYLTLDSRLADHLRVRISIGFALEGKAQPPASFDLNYDSHTNSWSWKR